MGSTVSAMYVMKKKKRNSFLLNESEHLHVVNSEVRPFLVGAHHGHSSTVVVSARDEVGARRASVLAEVVVVEAPSPNAGPQLVRCTTAFAPKHTNAQNTYKLYIMKIQQE